MKTLIFTGVLCLFMDGISTKSIIEDYKMKKEQLINQEIELSLGGKLKLSPEEKIANDILMKWKERESYASKDNPHYFNFTGHYFKYKKNIEKSRVYQIIKKMPKGAVLHVHGSLMLGGDYLLNVTYEYEDDLYICDGSDDLNLWISDSVPKRPCDGTWKLLSERRKASKDIKQFDDYLKKHLSLDDPSQEVFDPDINKVWIKFEKVVTARKNLLNYRPVREKYLHDVFQKFYDDGVLYLELRGGFSKLHELNGTVHDPLYYTELLQNVVEKFTEEHTDFMGVKLIYTSYRQSERHLIKDHIDMITNLKKAFPELFAGYDLVGQEDIGKTLEEQSPVLLKADNDLDFFFHAGETNSFGMPSDENLFDAILLGSKRIGHGNALMKHPTLLAAVNAKDIAIEVNVISNSVLSLVSDLRQHPLASFLSLGLPVVLSSDDPGAWDAEPLSHDFFVAFLAVANRRADLRMLKQLAINSIKYSSLEEKLKRKFYRIFNNKWNSFISDVIATR